MDAKCDRKCIRQVGSGRIHDSVGEVKEPDRPINEGKAESNEGIDGTGDDAVKQYLFDQIFAPIAIKRLPR